MQVNASNYVYQAVYKVEAHSSGITCVSKETYFKGKCSFMIKNLVEIMQMFSLDLLETP